MQMTSVSAAAAVDRRRHFDALIRRDSTSNYVTRVIDVSYYVKQNVWSGTILLILMNHYVLHGRQQQAKKNIIMTKIKTLTCILIYL